MLRVFVVFVVAHGTALLNALKTQYRGNLLLDYAMDTMSRRRRQKGDPCGCLRPIIRLWGVITSIGKDIMNTSCGWSHSLNIYLRIVLSSTLLL